ncbi:MAG: F0F1 ATP synthase subunit A [Defluviitaleaceae bacterium]|nr:F0F1 ATP synthase subunit A [Defluviitaleaceae bacterium]
MGESAISIENKNIAYLFEVFGQKIYITETLVSTWVVMAVLIALAVVVRVKIKNWKEKPSGFQNIIEMAVETMHNFVRSTMGDNLDYFGGYFFAIFAFIFVSNYSGLLGFRPPTTNLATTLAMGLSTFAIIHYMGMTKQTRAYFKEYMKPMFLFLPLNIIGELSRPVSLSFRLFGNILGGMIILKLIYNMAPLPVRFVFPVPAHALFDVWAGALQAFVFTILSMSFIKIKANAE